MYLFTNIFFFRFPKHSDGRIRWLQCINKSGTSVLEHHKICSKHFKPECFFPSNGGQTRKLLRPKAMPHLDLSTEIFPPVADASSLLSDHNYFLLQSPAQMKKQNEELLKELDALKAKVKLLREKLRRERKRVHRHQYLKKKMKKRHSEEIKQLPEPLQQIIARFRDIQKSEKIPRQPIPVELAQFCVAASHYSRKAYCYVRKAFGYALPHPRTISKWFTGFKVNPGFTHQSLELLKSKVLESSSRKKDVIVVLSLDEMAIHSQASWTGSQFIGYPDYGNGFESFDLATEALVFLVTEMDVKWKLPIGFFFTNGTKADRKAGLVQEALKLIHSTGARTIAVVCDGTATHLKMFEELGAELNPDNPKPFFANPSNPDDFVYTILDICHMIKLVRNNLASQKFLKDMMGKRVEWMYIERLHKLQDEEGFRAGNKLRKRHVDFKNVKMKVCIAAQTLSNSVADSLDFVNNHLQLLQFAFSGPTASFIRIFDRLFDILNSRNHLAGRYKAPMTKKNKEKWEDVFEHSLWYISQLDNDEGTPILKSQQRTGFLGFCIAIKAFRNIFDDLVEGGHKRCIKTFGFSQDHLVECN